MEAPEPKEVYEVVIYKPAYGVIHNVRYRCADLETAIRLLPMNLRQSDKAYVRRASDGVIVAAQAATV